MSRLFFPCTGTLRCGATGWSFRDWDRTVYPRPQPRGFHPLEFLAGRFETVEIHSTFEQSPRPELTRLWAAKVARNPDFRFTARAPRRFTYERDLSEAAAFTEAMKPLAEQGRLGAVLMQFPGAFKFTPENRDFLIRVRRALHAFPLVAELRRTPSVTVLEGVDAEDLLLRDGAVVGLAARRGAERLRITASAVVLATGGLGGLYARTSNPLGARGDGLAIAARAGARLADLEFVQFHPTALDLGVDPMPLATEALRGEGAVLVNSLGERFMQGLHPLADLAPRDVVARAIFRERAAGRRVFLDARAALGGSFAERFPTVYAACRQAGLDPATQPMPVAPAAHYHMGGIAVDGEGRSSVPGLWAVGEVAATGLHGANRLASNSLLEALVFGERAARDIGGLAPSTAPLAGVAGGEHCAGPEDAAALDRLRRTMDEDVGVERDAAGLSRAVAAFAPLAAGQGTAAGQALRNAATAALLVAVAALGREESRGGHFRSDHPAHAPGPARRQYLALADALARASDTGVEPVARAAAG